MLRLIIAVGVFSMFFVFCPIEKGWKGILPFQTNREQVEKILGKPLREDGDTFYKTDNALVLVIYSASPCSNIEKLKGSYNIPEDTVIKYSVVLEEGINLPDLEWEKELYEKFKDPHIMGINHYNNLKDGVSFETYSSESGVEKVGIIYFDSTKEIATKYACSKTDEKIK